MVQIPDDQTSSHPLVLIENIDAPFPISGHDIQRYKSIEDIYERILQIVLDQGPICSCLVAAYAGHSAHETKLIIKKYTEMDMVRVKDEIRLEGPNAEKVTRYYTNSQLIIK